MGLIFTRIGDGASKAMCSSTQPPDNVPILAFTGDFFKGDLSPPDVQLQDDDDPINTPMLTRCLVNAQHCLFNWSVHWILNFVFDLCLYFVFFLKSFIYHKKIFILFEVEEE